MEILDRNDRLPLNRIKVVQFVIVCLMLGLVYGLWQLQILQAEKYAGLAEHNRIRTEPIPAPRGRIIDREGRVIVDNYPSFTAYLLRDTGRSWEADLPAIAKGLFIDLNDLQIRLAHYASAPIYQPIPIKEDITGQDVAFLAAHRDEFPELETVMVPRRLYPINGFASHLIGYVGEPDVRQMAADQLGPGSSVGKSGVEQYYNSTLMGVDGSRRVMVDSHGRPAGELSDREPSPGHDLRLTIDIDVQTAAENALGDRPGAVVALDPRNGEILAMASRPSFDPNQFAQGLSSKVWQQWLNDPDHPLLNKAIQAQLAPGSVFKLVTAVAGLQENVAQDMTVNCQGGIEMYGHYYGCWIAARNQVHGTLNLKQAIVQSCDVYFYTLGNQLGIDTLSRYAKAMGLGRPTGIDLPHEAPGLVATPQWKQARYHQAWFRGDTINVSIGQGMLDVTPLQVARTIGGLASGGVFKQPHVIMLPPASKPLQGDFTYPLADATVGTITDAMRGVVGDGGTAASAHIDGVDFGGKTGTAQTISTSVLQAISGSHRQYIDNAWFIGVYPSRNPEIAVCVLFQRGAEGYFAGRIASQVVQAYYKKSTQQRVAQAGTP